MITTAPDVDDEEGEEANDEEGGNRPSDGTAARDFFIGDAEHKAAIGIVIDAFQGGSNVKIAPRFGEENAEEAALDEVTHALPKADKGFGPCDNLATVKGFVERTDGDGNFFKVGFKTKAFQIFGMTPSYICQNADIERNAKPTKKVRL
jgi:hypothetical protein